MAKRTLSIRQNKDGTITINSGHYRENIEIRFKSAVQKYDYVRWAIITAGFEFSAETELLVRKELDFWV